MKRVNWVYFGVMMLLAAAVVGCEGEIVAHLIHSHGDGDVPTQLQESRSVHVTGSGSVVGTPDMAILNLGVSVERETVAEAREIAATSMTAVIDSLQANGIAEKDIQTERFSIYPQYDWTENERVLRGYRVDNTVSAKARDLTQLSAIIDDAAVAGGDVVVVNSIQFTIEDTTPLQAQARGLAVKDAEAKAETLATAAGVTLGKPITITETSYAASPPIAYAEEAAFADDSAFSSTPIAAGELTVTVNINIVYEVR